MLAYIYKITNHINQKWLVGSSQNPKVRESCHFSLLRKGTHENRHLQSAWNKYGAENFEFIIIASCQCREDAYHVEQEFIDEHLGQPYCYNLNNRAIGGPSKPNPTLAARNRLMCGSKHPNFGKSGTFKGKKHTKEWIEKTRIRNSKMKQINLVHTDGLIYTKFTSITEAAKELGLHKGNLWSVFKGRLNSTGGWKELY